MSCDQYFRPARKKVRCLLRITNKSSCETCNLAQKKNKTKQDSTQKNEDMTKILEAFQCFSFVLPQQLSGQCTCVVGWQFSASHRYFIQSGGKNGHLALPEVKVGKVIGDFDHITLRCGDKEIWGLTPYPLQQHGTGQLFFFFYMYHKT